MNKIKNIVAATFAASTLLITAGPSAYAAEPTGEAAAAPAANQSPEERLDQLNDQLERANGELDKQNRKLAADKQKEAEIGLQLAAFARIQYKQPIALIQFIRAASFNQMLGDIARDRLIADKERMLLRQSHDLRNEDEKTREGMLANLAKIKASRDEAARIAAEAKAEQEAALRARALAIAQSSAVQTQFTPALHASTGGAQQPGPVLSNPGSGPNRFAYGYCTWYVANRRYIPFLGNAIDWWPNARAYGFAEGSAPRVGAVMVTRESGYGHVAYVESVNGDGSWTVSEMNFRGWNVVSSRTIRPGQTSVVGFIYG
ncbi:MAG: CHAP domain-containing protein [Candidatus Dormibacteraeota bacterium]|nr:CHAP domain-containing protein [Candidatus Dormibacteraeota bacterium]